MKVGSYMQIVINKPISGTYHDISKANDDVFGQKLLGPGFLVDPTDKDIYAPIKGIVKMIYPTKHAFAISNDAYDILIHIGITETLRDPLLFQLHVSLHDEVNIGDKIMTLHFDFKEYEPKDYQIPIVFVQKKDITLIHETDKEITLNLE